MRKRIFFLISLSLSPCVLSVGRFEGFLDHKLNRSISRTQRVQFLLCEVFWVLSVLYPRR